MGGHGGDVGFRSRMFGEDAERFWRLSFWRVRSATETPTSRQVFQMAFVDQLGKAGYGTGTCAVQTTEQTPLDADEVAQEITP